MINPVQVIVGIIVALVVVAALLYVFISRTNAVEKTGYGSLIMLSVISLMIPVFWIVENNQEIMAKQQQEIANVGRGATLYATYCYQCHGTKGQGRVGPKLNGNPAVNNLSDNDLIRIISAGIYNTDASKLNVPIMPAWSQTYGGPLTDDDIQYLFDLIRSSDPAYQTKNGYTGTAAANGFSQVPNDIMPVSAYQTAVAQESTGQFGAAVDMTSKSAITIDIIPSPAGSTCQPACYSILNVKVKVGTVITWMNTDPVAHTVTAIQGTNVSQPKIASQIFDSGIATGIQTGKTFTYKVTMAAYNLNPNHTVIYYCQYHPSMLAELTIVP
jgi:plastocyanin/mono/diheme cytochrome c family protein